MGGLLILVWRPPLRLSWFPASLLVLAIAALIDPSVTFLVFESAMIGVLLTALLAVIQWIVDRRRPVASAFGETGSRATGLGPPGSTMSRVAVVSSDDSTAIRSRPVAANSTAEHVYLSPPATADLTDSNRPQYPLRPRRGGKMSCSSRWFFLGLLIFTPGAAPPEVVRLRVPSQSVSKWFPPGTELKGISAADFETLIGAALSGSRTTTAEDSPRLLRSSHSARWKNGLLIGRSELIVEPSSTGSDSLVLEPWTPAIDLKADGSSSIRADSSGQTLLRINPPAEPGKTTTAVIDWQLQAREGSKGRKFALALPGTGPSELKLDLPEGLEPEGLTGLRRGSASNDGRICWIFTGPVGRCDLLLVDSTSKANPPGDLGLWIAGPIRIDIE